MVKSNVQHEKLLFFDSRLLKFNNNNKLFSLLFHLTSRVSLKTHQHLEELNPNTTQQVRILDPIMNMTNTRMMTTMLMKKRIVWLMKELVMSILQLNLFRSQFYNVFQFQMTEVKRLMTKESRVMAKKSKRVKVHRRKKSITMKTDRILNIFLKKGRSTNMTTVQLKTSMKILNKKIPKILTIAQKHSPVFSRRLWVTRKSIRNLLEKQLKNRIVGLMIDSTRMNKHRSHAQNWSHHMDMISEMKTVPHGPDDNVAIVVINLNIQETGRMRKLTRKVCLNLLSKLLVGRFVLKIFLPLAQ